MFFTFYNILFWGGIIFFIIGILNVLDVFNLSLGKIIVCSILVLSGIAGFWFGDQGRRQEIFQFEIEEVRELNSETVQILFNGNRTSVPSNQITTSKELYEDLLKEDENGVKYLEATREQYKELKR